jgi:carboxypeptidase PM20D1
MRRILIRIAAVIVALGLVIAAAVLIKTVSFTSKQVKVEKTPAAAVDAQSAARRLSAAIQIPTISYEDEKSFRGEEFLRFHKYLEKTYPRLHKQLTREVINTYSLLYTWAGRNKNLKPVLLVAHMDVVPVDQTTKDKWSYAPFSGQIAEGYIWGRGTLDNKSNLLAIMEAVEGLLKSGYAPARTVYLVSGHDEERGGAKGAMAIAGFLKARGVALDYVIDEGLLITDGMIPGVSKRVAMIGLAEKGFMNVELTARGAGGHAAMPPRETAVGILCRAIAGLESNPPRARFDGPARYMFDFVGREMSFPQKMIFANLWLTEGLVIKQLEKASTTNALIHTTCAPTMLEGSNKINVLPYVARAGVNYRILPGDTPEKILEYIRRTINDARVEVKPVGMIQKPSPVASIDSKSFQSLQKTIRQIFPDIIVAPSLAVVGSDSRHFAGLTGDIYKFAPMIMTAQDVARLHGINERLSVDNYAQMIRFYTQLIANSQE